MSTDNYSDKSFSVGSPCIDICALDDNDICIGCHRHGNEISNWNSFSNEEKLSVLQKTQRRARGESI